MTKENKSKKSDGVEDIFHWLEHKCKEQKKVVDDLNDEAHGPWRFLYEDDLELAKVRLNTLVEIKIGVEKYMKKLRHQGE